MPKFPRLGTALFALMVAATVGQAIPDTCAAQELEDVVYLKDGSIIRGVIVEQIPNESILIETRDGNRFRYAMDLIARMTKEQPIASAPAASAPAAQSTGGVPAQRSSAEEWRSPTTAWGMSFLFPGGGQFYNGQIQKGVIFAVIGAAGAFTAIEGGWDCGYWDECGWMTGGLVVYLGSWVVSQVDAYRFASARNRSLGVGRSLDFQPQLVVFKRPGLASPAGASPVPRVGLSLVRLTF